MHFPTSTSDWALGVSLLALTISFITFALSEVRRRERVSIKASFGHKIRRSRDRYLHPIVFKNTDPAEGERCLLVTVKYNGRHSLVIRSVSYEATFGLFSFPFYLPEDSPLYDGQSRTYLLAERDVLLRDIQGIAVETAGHGVRLHRVRWFLRFQNDNRLLRPKLYRLLYKITRYPRVITRRDFEPKTCPECGAGRGHFKLIAERFVDTTLPNGTPTQAKNRRFRCECKHEWSADTVEPEQPL